MKVKVGVEILKNLITYNFIKFEAKKKQSLFYRSWALPFSDSSNVLTELENIDDEADVFKIRFVRIHDLELAEDYSLYYMPSLVYFRSGMPIVYEGKKIIWFISNTRFILFLLMKSLFYCNPCKSFLDF